MLMASRQTPNTALAVTIDTGDPIELHPKNKQPIGIRHALLALERTYHLDIVGSGPSLRDHTITEGNVTLTFDSTGSGLMAGREGSLDSYAIAGEDRKWHWAEAKIEEKTVVVSSASVPKP